MVNKNNNKRKIHWPLVFKLLVLFSFIIVGPALGADVDDELSNQSTASDHFGGDIYYLFVHEILMGPIGFVVSVGLITWGLIMAGTGGGGMVLPVVAIVAGAIIFKIDSVVKSFGLTIPFS